MAHIVQITPGTGGYHCGVCLRDHELTIQLRQRGLHVTQVPLYLPLYTDKQESEHTPLFFGAVNAWLQQEFSLFRHTPRWLDAVFDSAPLLRLASRKADTTTARNHGDMTVSMLQGSHGRQKKELVRLADWLAEGEKPDLICVGTALLAGMLPYLKERFNCPVLCTLQGEDSFLDDLPAPWAEQAWQALAAAAPAIDGFIAPSHWYAERMAPRLNVPVEAISVLYNGIDLADFRAPAPPPATPTIGFLAHLCPPKGLHSVVDAFIRMHADPQFHNLRLHIAGSLLQSETDYLDEQKLKIHQAGLEDYVSIRPNLSRADKISFLQELTVFTVPALYGEAFGLYLPEAWAAGIPVVQPRSGAFPELLELSQAGLIYELDDPRHLDTALAAVLTSPETRRMLSENGHNAATTHFASPAFAANIAKLYNRFILPPKTS